MKQIDVFYLTGCPYCANARKAIGELQEDPAYRDISIRWIEERENPDLADQRDYFRVPTLYYGEKKLYEAEPSHGFDTIRSRIRAAFDTVIGG